MNTPSPSRRRRAGAALLLAAGLALLAGCGRKGPPLAPLRRVPLPVTDLRLRQLGDATIAVGWATPATYADGVELGPVSEFVLYLLPFAEKPGAPPSSRTVVEGYETKVDGENVPVEPTAFRFGPDVIGADPTAGLVTHDVRLMPRWMKEETPSTLYGVLVYDDANGRGSPHSRPVELVLERTPAAPESVAAEMRADGVHVDWTATEGLRYQVYRRPSDGAFGWAPVSPLPVVGSTWHDVAVAEGDLWVYGVRTLGVGPKAESSATESAPVRVQDRFAPEPPTGLAVFPGPASVRLVWFPIEEELPAEYRIYRADSAEGPFSQIGTVDAQVLTWEDTDVAPGSRHHYHVTAVDRSPHANESVPSNVAIGSPQ